jgi:hypothetical protein
MRVACYSRARFTRLLKLFVVDKIMRRAISIPSIQYFTGSRQETLLIFLLHFMIQIRWNFSIMALLREYRWKFEISLKSQLNITASRSFVTSLKEKKKEKKIYLLYFFYMRLDQPGVKLLFIGKRCAV